MGEDKNTNTEEKGTVHITKKVSLEKGTEVKGRSFCLKGRVPKRT